MNSATCGQRIVCVRVPLVWIHVDWFPLTSSTLLSTHRSPLLWEQMRPCPPGPVEDFKRDSRYREVKKMIGNMYNFSKVNLFDLLMKKHHVMEFSDLKNSNGLCN